MAIDYGTARGQVRLLTADVDGNNFTLTDDQVDGYLTLHGITTPTAAPVSGVGVRRAAADALSAIATSEVLLSKVIRSGDGLTTDGAKAAAELRTQAAALRAQADVEETLLAEASSWDDDESGFGVAEFTPWPAL